MTEVGPKPHRASNGGERAFPFPDCAPLLPSQSGHVTVLLFTIIFDLLIPLSHLGRSHQATVARVMSRVLHYNLAVFFA